MCHVSWWASIASPNPFHRGMIVVGCPPETMFVSGVPACPLSRVGRSGPQAFSQEKAASYAISHADLEFVLHTRSGMVSANAADN